MTKYRIDFYKNQNLTSDERNAMRKNQSGIWLCTGFSCMAESAADAVRMAKNEENTPLGVNQGFKLRARKA